MVARGLCITFALVAVASAILSACAPVPPSGGVSAGPITAELRIAGETVRLNEAAAYYGQPVRPGNSVSTGPDSSALIAFSDGTTVQLDQLTDPVILSWGGDRLEIRMDDGALQYIKGARIRIVEVITDLADFFSFSRFVVEERKARFVRADLFTGQMQLTRPVTGPVQRAGDYFQIRRGVAEPEYGRTSRADARRLLQRFERWDFVSAQRERTRKCPDAQRWDPIEQACVCPPELPYWQNNQCITCIGGMFWNGRNCECPEGSRWDGSRCAPYERTRECPDAQRWDPIEQACVCPPELPYWQNNQCITCIGGMFWNGRNCECPEGSRWDGSRCVFPRGN